MKVTQEHELLANVETTLPEARRVLVFAPHPDDEVFGCGGLITLLRRAGADVMVHVLTDGSRGGSGDDPSLVAHREDESREAAKVLGLPAPHFWGLPDRGVHYNELLIERLQQTVDTVDADLILFPAVTETHPDHQALALAGVEALRRLGGDRKVAFYEVSAPLPMPNLLVDITEVEALKQRAMECFTTQLEQQPYDVRVGGLNRFRAYSLAAQVQSAEAFLWRPVQDLFKELGELFEGTTAYRRRLGYVADPADLPLVSVIVRSMDRATLGRALDSVAVQTYPNIEIVVVNASGNEHSAMGENCGHFPLHLVDDRKQLPRSHAANTGLAHARGSYLIFLDDDDWFYPSHIYSLVEGFHGDEETVAIYSSVKMVNESGSELGVLAEEYDLTHLRLQNYIPIHALLFKRTVVDAGVRFDETLNVCEDWDFWLNVAEYGQFKHLNNISAVYVINDKTGSGIRSNEKNTNDEATRIYRKWLLRWDDATLWSILDYARNKKRLDNCVRFLSKAGFTGSCLDDYLENVKNTKQQADNLQLAVAGLQQENQRLVLENQIIARENQSRLIENQIIVRENQSILLDKQNIIQENERVVQEYKKLALENQSILLKNQSILLENQNLVMEKQVLILEITELNEIISKIKDKNIEINNEYKKLVSSKSWKITRPFRCVGQIVKNLIR